MKYTNIALLDECEKFITVESNRLGVNAAIGGMAYEYFSQSPRMEEKL